MVAMAPVVGDKGHGGPRADWLEIVCASDVREREREREPGPGKTRRGSRPQDRGQALHAEARPRLVVPREDREEIREEGGDSCVYVRPSDRAVMANERAVFVRIAS